MLGRLPSWSCALGYCVLERSDLGPSAEELHVLAVPAFNESVHELPV